MQTRFFYSAVRIVALSLAAAAGYVPVYIQSMKMFAWRQPLGFLPILVLPISAAFASALLADKLLPRPTDPPDSGREAGR